jgi:hypothetical protein
MTLEDAPMVCAWLRVRFRRVSRDRIHRAQVRLILKGDRDPSGDRQPAGELVRQACFE